MKSRFRWLVILSLATGFATSTASLTTSGREDTTGFTTASLKKADQVANMKVNTEDECLAPRQFSGTVQVRWEIQEGEPDREMTLLTDFTYCDSEGTPWTAPTGAVIDGASIPRVAWPVTGSPYVGDYRMASVIHDHYCKTRSRNWQSVHRVFYDAMLASGVSRKKAKVLYGAVRAAGPRWTEVAGAMPGTTEIETIWPVTNEDSLWKIADWIEANDPSILEIEDFVRKAQDSQ